MKATPWMLAPAVLGAIVLALLETGVVFPARNPITSVPDVETFADTIVRHGVEQAYAHIRAGRNPNEPVPFRDPRLTGGQELRLTPLAIALAARNENTALMLLSYGTDLTLPEQAGIACLADWVDLPGVAKVIRATQGRDATCPPKPDRDTPLVAPFAR